MKTSALLFVVLSIILCSGCNKDQNQLDAIQDENISGKIVISGAYALYPLVETWANEFKKKYPNVQLEVIKSGTGQGIKDITEKKSDLAMISRDLNQDEYLDSMWIAPVARDGVVPVINIKNPIYSTLMTRGLTIAELLDIFTSEKNVKWDKYIKNGCKKEIKVFSRYDNSGAAEVYANFLHSTQSEFTGIKVEGDENMIISIQKNIYSIGFCNLYFAFDHISGKLVKDIQILPIDLNFNGKIDKKEEMADSLAAFQRKIWCLKFPRNLCRSLSIASIHRPEKEVKLFMKWVLSDGQEYVVKSGYSELNSPEILCKLKSLE